LFAKLTGKIDTLASDSLILDVGGVGYHVFASGRTLGAIGGTGDGASLLVETHVREDHIHLYGFATASEREWFRLLTGVQGVGARSALAILTVCPPEKLLMAIAANDVHILRQAEGVGPKLATRIVSELKSKVENLSLAATTPVAGKAANKPGAVPTFETDAVSALVNLGYGRGDAFTAVATARAGGADTLDALIRSALKELSAG
jgi:holliday junction DNA helicase RuvA